MCQFTNWGAKLSSLILICVAMCATPAQTEAGIHGKLTVINLTDDDITVTIGAWSLVVPAGGGDVVFEPEDDSVTNTKMVGRK